MDKEVERVLANWIDQALSPQGQLPPGVSPAQWVAAQFLHWWRSDFEDHLDEWLGDADSALATIKKELERAGGWEQLGEAMHECSHLQDALASIRAAVLPKDQTRFAEESQ
jgi:hypothetical protein